MHTYRKKSDFNRIIKNHQYGSITSDKIGNGGQYKPYRDYEGKIVKGISLFRTSPVTFTDAGSEHGIKIVDKLVRELREIGNIQRTSEFSFILLIQISKKIVLKIKTFKNEKEGLIYDQTYHYLDFRIENLLVTEIVNNVGVEFKSEQTDFTKPLTDKYLDYVLGIY